MVKIGMMIGDRYEILEKIGTGGMSDVYKAKCHKLNRFVAVKVLKQEFSENANFVSKFRVEAQAAAGLAHPNIVNVFDVGEENGIHYIVMELVDGLTLKKYIEKKAGLSYKEAISIAIQVSMGIEAAHNNHIIHRDIKPQNIMISKDGKVKVTDFGIAKAATSNTITSNVMGSVHYTSPEQARGGYSDEKSDIYSLGITLYEMLTGRVPFNGETTVAIAIKHIQNEFPSPRDFVPEIPVGVEAIVLKCCQKSPDRRYQSMPELVSDLKQVLMNPGEDFVVQNDLDTDGGTRMITEGDMEQIRRMTAVRVEEDQARAGEDYGQGEEFVQGEEYVREEEYVQEEGNYVRNEEEYVREDAGHSGDGGMLAEYDEDEYDYNPRFERMTAVLAIAAGVIVCLAVAVLAFRMFGGGGGEDQTVSPSPAPTASGSSAPGNAGSVEVPKVTEMSYQEAENTLRDRGFAVTKVDGYSNDVMKGFVIAQVPDAGTMAPAGFNIAVTVSQGGEKVRVPKFMGLSEAQAAAEAERAGVEIGESVSYVYDTEYNTGQICFQSYSEGSYVEPGTKVEIKVSKGLEKVTYRCNANIQAPTAQEAPDYAAGTEVEISLVTDGGQVLLNTKTSSFPQSANYYGLNSAAGTITMTYMVTSGGTTAVDPATGGTVSIPGVSEPRSFTRRIDFTKE